MSATPWTSGPWVDIGGFGWVGANGKPIHVARCRVGHVSAANNPEAVANGRLLLHAAEMAEALEQTAAAMDALHPPAAGDMSDADYARLWNATRDRLEELSKRIRGDAP